jgi:tetratricopeptide (TPR) repeat protein
MLPSPLPERKTDVQLPPLRVFVSSTSLDLQPERKAVETALQRLRADTGYVGMEYFGSRDENARDASLDEVDRSRIYIGIFAARYGSGITEDEYRRARQRGLPCFIYFKADPTITPDKVEQNPEQIAKLDKLKAELRQAHVVSHFVNPDDLTARVTADLHRWILDEYLPHATGSQAPFATLHQLRAPVSDFVGREHEINALVDMMGTGQGASICGISGMGGTGKTELALLVANRMRPAYKDAQLFIDLRGTGERPLSAADALAKCIRAFAGADAKLPADVDELGNIYRNALDGKRALILLDNAADSAQVSPLRPPHGCALLITSREMLALPGLKRIVLEQLQPGEARDLLTGIAARTSPGIADQICQLCGYLPLALRAAGSLLDVADDLDPAAYAVQLHDERERLKLIGREGVDLDIEASFELSYARLQPEAARVFRRLAVFPATFDAAAEEGICEDTGNTYLRELRRRSLILYNTETTRYRLHDLVRLFADSRVSVGERRKSQALHSIHYLRVLIKAKDLYLEGGEAFMRGLALFDSEWSNIQAGQAWCARYADINDVAAQLCFSYPTDGTSLLSLRQDPRERIDWLEKALSAARRLNDRRTEADCLSGLGSAYVELGELRRGIEFHEQHLALARELGDQRGEHNALGNLGIAYGKLGELEHAITIYQQVLAIDRKNNDRRSAGQALCNLGNVYYAMGEPTPALMFFRKYLRIAREFGDRHAEGNALWNMSQALQRRGSISQALAHAEAGLVILEEIGDRNTAKMREVLAKWPRPEESR